MSQIYEIQSNDFQEINSIFEQNTKDTDFCLTESSVIPICASECRSLPLVLSNTNFTEEKSIGLLLDGAENITVDFHGAMVECEGQLQPLTILNSRNITIRNLTIDWKIPLSAEGTVVEMAEDYLVVQIDPVLFPFEVREGRLFFGGNGEVTPMWTYAHTAFSPEDHTVCMISGDELQLRDCEQMSEDTVRFTGRFSNIYQKGTVLVLRHSERIHAGIFAENCQNVTFENVAVHATGGLGILCQFNRDLTFRNVRFEANQKKGRKVVCGHDDGLHLMSNSGQILIENCSFRGLMDDPINVHGAYARVEEVIDEHTVKGRFVHHQSTGFKLFARTGDCFSLIRNTSMHRIGKVTAEAYELLDRDTFVLRVSEALPEGIRSGDALENLTNTPALICRNNELGGCRARGILVTTPQPVLIEKNRFQSAGSAILISGDANSWYESGACENVVIRGNTFTKDCLTTQYEGCKGVISIWPIVPEPLADRMYHRNIKIEDNTFCCHGVPLLYAFSTENLTFAGNRIEGIEKTSAADEKLYCLENCTQTEIRL